jgi:hypothetical protein
VEFQVEMQFLVEMQMLVEFRVEFRVERQMLVEMQFLVEFRLEVQAASAAANADRNAISGENGGAANYAAAAGDSLRSGLLPPPQLFPQLHPHQLLSSSSSSSPSSSSSSL